MTLANHDPTDRPAMAEPSLAPEGSGAYPGITRLLVSTADRELATSIRAKVQADGAQAVLVCAPRQPEVAVQLVERLIRAWEDPHEALGLAFAALPTVEPADVPLILVQGPALFDGPGLELIRGAWRERISASLLVAIRRKTTRDDLERATQWLTALGMPPMGVVWDDDGLPPLGQLSLAGTGERGQRRRQRAQRMLAFAGGAGIAVLFLLGVIRAMLAADAEQAGAERAKAHEAANASVAVAPASRPTITAKIDPMPVTRRAYSACVEARACPGPVLEPADVAPAVGLPRAAAAAYCASVGGRLPSLVELSTDTREDSRMAQEWTADGKGDQATVATPEGTATVPPSFTAADLGFRCVRGQL